MYVSIIITHKSSLRAACEAGDGSGGGSGLAKLFTFSLRLGERRCTCQKRCQLGAACVTSVSNSLNEGPSRFVYKSDVSPEQGQLVIASMQSMQTNLTVESAPARPVPFTST